MDPGNAGAYEIKGDLYKRNQLIDEAMYQYSKAVELNPESSSGMSSVGDIYKMKGKLKEALHHFKKALDLNPDNPQTMMQLLSVKMSTCNWENFNEMFQHFHHLVT